jgi:hypothetical protein
MSSLTPIIIGIDPATDCGWSILRGNVRLDSGTWHSSPPPSRRGLRWKTLRMGFRGVLERAARLGPIAAVGYELVRRHEGVVAAHVYGGIEALLEEETELHRLLLLPIEVAEVKRLATGKGNAPKDDIVRAAEERWNIKVEDDNEADALFVALGAGIALGFATP